MFLKLFFTQVHATHLTDETAPRIESLLSNKNKKVCITCNVNAVRVMCLCEEKLQKDQENMPVMRGNDYYYGFIFLTISLSISRPIKINIGTSKLATMQIYLMISFIQHSLAINSNLQYECKQVGVQYRTRFGNNTKKSVNLNMN